MNRVSKVIMLLVLLMLAGSAVAGSGVVSLAGEWDFQLDPKNQGLLGNWQAGSLAGKIFLPGTTDEAAFGEKTVGSEYGSLTRVCKYIGPAWYKRTIKIPSGWECNDVELFLERVLWKTTAWVDGDEQGSFDSLATPHVYSLGKLKPGNHSLVIRIDNSLIHNIGDKGHSYGDHMQTIWNGIVGRIELRLQEQLSLVKPVLTADVDKQQLKVSAGLQNETSQSKAQLSIRVVDQKSRKTVLEKSVEVGISNGQNAIEEVFALNDKIRLWSEFDPAVYWVELTLTAGKYSDTKKIQYGFRKISQDGTHFQINDRTVFMRGNLDNVHFPLTGYPDMDVAGWERIFGILKSYGLNHVRFHSWCPPEAAFIAGDRIGIYLQPEAGIWIDGWMKGRTTFKPDGLGKVPDVDKFVQNELRRIVDAYGNHPSFVMMGIGNELGSSNFQVMDKWMSDLKEYDPRRLYAASTARRICPSDDYCTTHHLPGAGGTRGLRGGKTNWDFDSVVSKANIPIIAHELGQWPVYPDWNEIRKYKGVLRPRNLMGFRKVAKVNGIDEQDRDFQRSTGKFSQLLYKYEIESALRSSHMAGFHLLGLQDYSGQGEALIGILDSFYDSKGIIKPSEYRRFCDTAVPLLRIEKFNWQNNETLTAEIEVANYGEKAIEDAGVLWQLKNAEDKTVDNGEISNLTIAQGGVTKCGKVEASLNGIQKARHLTLEVQVKGRKFNTIANDWSVWVYPKNISEEIPVNVHFTDSLNRQAYDILRKGGRVVFDASRDQAKKAKALIYMPVYWSASWFPAVRNNQLGLLIKDKHPALNDFPTSYHSDWQWEWALKGAKAIVINDLDKSLKPIVQPVDNFHVNDKLGAIYEVTVGDGRLLISGIDISNTKENPVKKQLRYSLLKYAAGNKFSPNIDLAQEKLKSIFPNIEKAEAVEISSEFDNAVFHVKSAVNLKKQEQNVVWIKQLDEVISAEGYGYNVKTDGTWRSGDNTAWFAKNMTVTIDTPQGVTGYLYVWFHDWDNSGRRGVIEFEGRKLKLGQHFEDEGKWVKFLVMREDTLDSRLVFRCHSTAGPNLHVRAMALVVD